MRSAEHQVDDPTMGNNAKLASWRANMKTSLKRAITDGGAADFDPPTAKEDRPKLALVQQETPAPRKKLEFWESEKTRP
jgi:hypothetical protein